MAQARQQRIRGVTAECHFHKAHQPVLHHPDDGHGMAMAKLPLKGARLLAGRDGGEFRGHHN
ncbi:MAG: hypothetical protein WB773_24730 [Isosphaeraceae bacterium]